eukprot:259129_1
MRLHLSKLNYVLIYQLHLLLKDNHKIEYSNSPWRSSLFCRPKKTGDVRMVFDYRLLNSFTINDQFPLPDIHKLLHKFKGKQLFSLLDMRAGAFEFDGNLY